MMMMTEMLTRALSIMMTSWAFSDPHKDVPPTDDGRACLGVRDSSGR